MSTKMEKTKTRIAEASPFKLRRAVALRKRESYDLTNGLGGAKSDLSLGAQSLGPTEPNNSRVTNRNNEASRPIILRKHPSAMCAAHNHHSTAFSVGGGSVSSHHSRKRRREFLDLPAGQDSELVKFVLDTQGKLNKEEEERDSRSKCRQHSGQRIVSSTQSQSSSPYLEQIRSTSTLSSRSVKQTPSNQSDPFGLQKRRLVEDFQGLSLDRPRLVQQRSSPSKRQLIQVLNSVEFAADQDSMSASPGKSHSILDNGHEDSFSRVEQVRSVDNREHGQNGAGMSDSDDEEQIGNDASSSSLCSACTDSGAGYLTGKCTCSQPQNKTLGSTTKDSSQGFVRLEIADEDIREQVNREYMGNNRNFFLDKAASSMMTDEGLAFHSGSSGRSRSLNTPSALSQSADFNQGYRGTTSQFSAEEQADPISIRNYCCNYEIELRDRVLSSKRVLLRNFFTFYIKSLMMVNEKLNLSYLTKLKKEYMKMKDVDKISVAELHEAVDEMEVDEQSKMHLFKVLSEQTNLRDLLMSNEDAPEEPTNTNAAAPASMAVDEEAAREDNAEWYRLASPLSNKERSPDKGGMLGGSASTAAHDDIYMDVVE